LKVVEKVVRSAASEMRRPSRGCDAGRPLAPPLPSRSYDCTARPTSRHTPQPIASVRGRATFARLCAKASRNALAAA
jgi:hypothetical protein